MTYKTILVSLNDTPRLPELLEAASLLARRYEAHLIGLYVVPAVTIYPEVGMTMMPVVFEEYRNLFKGKLDEVRRDFEERAARDGLKAEWRPVDSEYPDIASAALAHSRLADLVIASQTNYAAEVGIELNLVDRLVMESGRPVLIIPQKGAFSRNEAGFCEKIVIGINATREASRAMFDALPLLRASKEVRLVWVDPYKQRHESGRVPGAEEAALLARHGIVVTAEPMMTDGRDAGEALLMRANDLGADLLVMGAYAHSRMREYVFGGATRHVLEHANIPVLMSH